MFCRSNERTEHQLQNGSLAKGVGDDLKAAALLDEQAFKQIRGSDRPAVCLRGSQVRNASFEVVHEAVKLGRPKIDSRTERKVRKQLAKGMGILRVAKALGIGTGTVQRISRELR